MSAANPCQQRWWLETKCPDVLLHMRTRDLFETFATSITILGESLLLKLLFRIKLAKLLASGTEHKEI